MANNFKQPGDVLKLIAPGGGVVSGGVYLIGDLVVVAQGTAAAAEEFSGATVGVWSVTKAGTQAWAQGEAVYFDGTEFTTVASTNRLAGVAVEAVGAGAGETTGVVRLNGAAVLASA